MKIKLMVSRKRYDKIAAELEQKGIEIDNSSTLVLVEENDFADFLMGKKDGGLTPVGVGEIVFIETFGNDVILHTMVEEYKISERLIRLESLLNPTEFLRISNSVIVSVKRIKSIRPTFSSKYILTLQDGTTVDVTRSYFNRFKEFFGL
ncbi:MAG: LytTR family DNA-binding domain-containing protein [Ruminococcus sp.]|jgi:DNA-binding LytR/AlgR family response regulator|nr:LytTR family DNA-binding domain-containing protein [Ruminococcus sp.]